jgi:hypothetical protein
LKSECEADLAQAIPILEGKIQHCGSYVDWREMVHWNARTLLLFLLNVLYVDLPYPVYHSWDQLSCKHTILASMHWK